MSGSNRRVDMPSKSSRSQGSDRVSVFSRLGTKGGSSGKTSAPAGERSSSSGPSGVCRQWLETGHCQYQSKCKFASSHSLVSPSKRPDPPSGETRSRKEAAPGTSKKRGENSPEFDLDDLTGWENLDYDDELLLEKKRQLLERELAKQGHPIKATDEDKKESVAVTTAGPPQAKKPKMGPKPPTNQPTQTKKSSGPWTSGVQQPSSNSSSSSSSSSDSDSSSSSDSSSDSSSEPSKKKSKPLPKKVVKPTEDKKKKMSDRKPTKSIGLKGGAPPAKKTSAKSASVSGSKVSRYHPESSDKKKRKIKKVRGSVKRPRSPSTSKSATKRPIGKDDKSQDSKSNPVRKGGERDKFGFYHATAPTSAEGGGSKDAGGSSRGWKPKRPSDQQQRRASLSPSRMNTDSSAKRQKKSIKSVTTTKRSQSNERRGGSSRPPVSRRSSHSPHAKRRPSPKASAAGGSRGGSAGRERDHRPHTNRDEHHRDIRREDSRGKFDRDRKPGATSSNRSHNPPTRENWSRYQGQPPPREERSHKSPGGNRDRGQSPPPRSSAPQSDSRKYKDKIQFSGGNAVRVEPRSEHRDKQHSHSRISRERERSPRDRLLPPEALQRHRGVNKERERSPRERLLSPEGIQRERFNRDQNRFSRERGSNESAPPRERDRERDRGMPDYPKRASPFERLGGPRPGSHKRWEGRASSADRGDNRDAGTSSDKDATLTHSSPKRSETQKKVNPDSVHKEEQDEAKPTQNSPTPSKGETKTDGLMESTSLDTNTKSPPGNDEEKEAAFSDLEINDSDEGILNKNSNENEEEGQLQTSNEAVEEDETEEGEVGGIDSRSSSRKSNLNDASLVPLVTSRSEKQNNDLLEGISDGDLDISEDDDAKSKIADALGVDWSQLMNSKASLSENQSVTDIRKRWTVVSIFNRIGLCSQYLGDDYKKIVEEIKSKAEEGEKLELLHDIGGLHQRIKSLREKRNRYFCPTEPYVIPTKINWAV